MAELVRIAQEEAAQRTGQLLAAAIADVLNDRELARLAIPGGSAIHALPIARALLGSKWSSVHLTWVDERCVDFAHEDSNRGAAYRGGALSKEDPPGFELPLWLDGETPERAKLRVSSQLAEHFSDGLDLALLGMGPDGHIASLFPGHALLALDAKQVVASLSDSPKPPSERMTLTKSFLQRSAHNFLLALGEPKAPALRRLLAGDQELPATTLQDLTIITNLEIGAVT